MSYCSKCGKKNEEEAEFCVKCGASLTGSVKERKKEHDDRCEEECAVGNKSPIAPVFWGIIIILIGLWIIFSLVIPQTPFADNFPSWLVNFEFWWIIGIIIAIAIIVTGIRIIIKK